MIRGILANDSVQQGVEWAARGGLIAAVSSLAFTDVFVGQRALASGLSWYHLLGAGVATTGVLAATSSYRSKLRHIPTTIATDIYGALCLGYFGAKSASWFEEVGLSIRLLWKYPSPKLLHSLCYDSSWAFGMASAACGTGGGAIAFSGALREKESWAVQWEQRSHNFWVALCGLAGEGEEKLSVATNKLLNQVWASMPLVSRQYRESHKIAPSPQKREGVVAHLVQADRFAAKASYYAIWGAIHLAGLRASPFCYTAGIAARVMESQLAIGRGNRYFVFFEGGADGFADRSYRDRFFYLACLGFGGVLMNYWQWYLRAEILLPVALGILGASQSIQAWQSYRN